MSTAALFLLQVVVEQLAFEPPDSSSADLESPPRFVLAFQLLQFDIVLLEAESALEQRGGTVCVTPDAPLGQSCLFERDAKRLADEIRSDDSAALVLLVLQRTDQHARLVAFACVRLELPHLAFAGESARHPRVSEWVSVEASWPLVTHQNAAVGSIRGGVTLACLGRALAPHLVAQRFGSGLHLLTSTTPQDQNQDQDREIQGRTREEQKPENVAASVSVADGGISIAPRAQGSVASPTPELKSEQEELRDAAVQCSTDLDEDDNESNRRSHPKPILIRGDRHDSAPHTISPRLRVVDELERIKIGATASPRGYRSRSKEKTRSHHRHAVRISYDDDYSQPRQGRDQAAVPFLDDELPPPLYFHKPKDPSVAVHIKR